MSIRPTPLFMESCARLEAAEVERLIDTEMARKPFLWIFNRPAATREEAARKIGWRIIEIRRAWHETKLSYLTQFGTDRICLR